MGKNKMKNQARRRREAKIRPSGRVRESDRDTQPLEEFTDLIESTEAKGIPILRRGMAALLDYVVEPCPWAITIMNCLDLAFARQFTADDYERLLRFDRFSIPWKAPDISPRKRADLADQAHRVHWGIAVLSRELAGEMCAASGSALAGAAFTMGTPLRVMIDLWRAATSDPAPAAASAAA